MTVARFLLLGHAKTQFGRCESGTVNNHRASLAEGHSSLRRLDDKEKNAVNGLIAAGVKSRNIKASIMQACHNSDRRPLRTRDIYNFQYKKERELLGGEIPMQFLF